MKTKVESKYLKSVYTYGEENNLIFMKNDRWESKVLSEDKQYELIYKNESKIECKKEEEIKKDIRKMLFDFSNKIYEFKIKQKYQITFDISERVLERGDKKIFEKKEIIFLIVKYYLNDSCLLVDSFSTSVEEYKENLIKKFLNNVYEKIKKIFFSLSTKKVNEECRNIILSPYTSALLLHELVGHTFEKDNFYKLKNNMVNVAFPDFLSVKDNCFLNLSGYCKFDDFGNILYPIYYIKKGKIQENQVNEFGIEIFRAGEQKCINRLTNTDVEIEKHGYKNIEDFQDKAILIESINKCFLHKDVVKIYADAVYKIEKGILVKVPSVKIEINIYDALENIVCFYDKIQYYSSIDCIKQKQKCGGVGFSSAGMVLNFNNIKLEKGNHC